MDQPTQLGPILDTETALAFVRAWAEALPAQRELVRRAIAEESAQIRAAWPTLSALFSQRVPAGELRRPDLPGMRQPGEDLGAEVDGGAPG